MDKLFECDCGTLISVKESIEESCDGCGKKYTEEELKDKIKGLNNESNQRLCK